jgi:hypothetical protein
VSVAHRRRALFARFASLAEHLIALCARILIGVRSGVLTPVGGEVEGQPLLPRLCGLQMRVFAKGDTPVVPRSTLLDLDSLVEIARIQVPPDMRQRAPRYGRLGACSACRQPVLTHFDGAGRFLGCANVPEDTVFVLMPVTAAGRVVAMPALGTPPPPRIRRFKVARYTPAPITPLSGVPLTERRSLVRDVIMQAGEAGQRV